jgi:hypothetical protein
VKKKRKITEAHRKVLRENIKKARAKRWAKKKVIESKPEHPKKIVAPNSNGHQAVIGLNEFESIKEILHNCALAGLTLTNINNTYVQGEELRQLGSAIGEVCLEGITTLKKAKITKKPGRPKHGKKKTDGKISKKGARSEAKASG